MILGIDTATRWTGLALYDGTAVIAEHGWRSVNTQTIELTPAIAQMLQRAAIAPADLDGVAVAIGPGSYTGLRVGLGVAKGLALAQRVPLFGVPTLDIVAVSIGPRPGELLVTAEAGRSRVCAGLYRWQDNAGWVASGMPVIESWENVLAGLEGPTTFAGEISPQAARLIRSTKQPFVVLSPAKSTRRAGFLAEIGWRRLQKGLTDDAAALAPIYLRDPAGNPL